MTSSLTYVEALGLVAQCWTHPTTQDRVMDPLLAEQFALLLAREVNNARRVAAPISRPLFKYQAIQDVVIGDTRIMNDETGAAIAFRPGDVVHELNQQADEIYSLRLALHAAQLGAPDWSDDDATQQVATRNNRAVHVGRNNG